MTKIPTSADWHRDPDTAMCACEHLVARHQLVTRDVPVDRKQRSRYRQRLQPSPGRREHCTVPGCDCRSPR